MADPSPARRPIRQRRISPFFAGTDYFMSRAQTVLWTIVGTVIGLLIALPLWLGMAFLIAKLAHEWEVGW